MKAILTGIMAFLASALTITSCSTYVHSYGYDDDYRYGRNSNRYSTRNVTVESDNPDISYNLDLRAIANVFADSRNLEEFERRINDYESGINNLDLNYDGQVDYLRVIETSKRNSHLIVLQAVVGRDMFQDVASIIVERRYNRRHYVQVIGDPYIYGPYYIIEPVYVYSPPIFSFFWSSHYYRWHSPYYWGYYPSYWHDWNPRPANVYINNINIYVDNSRNTYRYSDRIANSYYNEMRKEVSRNDYQRANPDRSFSNRNAYRGNVSNRRDLGNVRISERRGGTSTDARSTSDRRDDASTRTRVGNGGGVRGSDASSRTGTSSRRFDSERNEVNTTTRDNSTRRGSGTVRSTEEWNSTRSGRDTQRSTTTRSQETTSRRTPGTTPSRSSYEQSTRDNGSSGRSSSTMTTPRSTEHRRSSGYEQPRTDGNSSRSRDTYSSPSTGRSSGASSSSSRGSSYDGRSSRSEAYGTSGRNSSGSTRSSEAHGASSSRRSSSDASSSRSSGGTSSRSSSEGSSRR